MPILSDEAIKIWTSAGNRMRQKRPQISTTNALLMGTNAKLPPLRVKIKVPVTLGGQPKSRQVRRAEERARRK